MHLAELLSLRSEPAAGISFGITQRCPLSCAHCSTNSTLSSREYPAEMFVRFVDSFRVDTHPKVLVMSGGEAMLRPKLVRTLAEKAGNVGTKTVVLSGMFFANSAQIPKLIKDAIAPLDHFSASIDSFHEREVPRANVFRVFDSLLMDGTDVSLHIVGQNADDPYLIDIINEVRHVFSDKVPMLINTVSYFGRARAWLSRDSEPISTNIHASPCAMAAWPVVGFDGTIVSCGNDDALDNVPKHLMLGHINSDDWSTIRERCLNSTMMRAIRLFGPEYIASRFSNTLKCDGYCQTCMKLSDDLAIEQTIDSVMAKPSSIVLEEQVSEMQKHAGATSFARQQGHPLYANLVTLGM